jgi:hypothetical protein
MNKRIIGVGKIVQRPPPLCHVTIYLRTLWSAAVLAGLDLRSLVLRRLVPGQPVEHGEHADHGRGVVRARLRLHVVVAVVPEPVAAVGPADDGADHDVGVGSPAQVPVVEPLRAPDELLAVLVRHDGRGAVVHPRREPRAVPDQVAHPARVAAQHVVHLRPGEREHLARGGGGGCGGAGDLGPGGGEVPGVGGEEERRAGHVLHVVPLPDVEHPARAALRVGAVVLAQARAHVVLRLGTVLLQRLPVVRRVLPP